LGRWRAVFRPLPGDGCENVGLEVQRSRFPQRWFKVVLSPPAGDLSEGGGRGRGVALADLSRDFPVFSDRARIAAAAVTAAVDTIA
jgi:hypothetical protein